MGKYLGIFAFILLFLLTAFSAVAISSGDSSLERIRVGRVLINNDLIGEAERGSTLLVTVNLDNSFSRSVDDFSAWMMIQGIPETYAHFGPDDFSEHRRTLRFETEIPEQAKPGLYFLTINLHNQQRQDTHPKVRQSFTRPVYIY